MRSCSCHHAPESVYVETAVARGGKKAPVFAVVSGAPILYGTEQ